VTVTIIAVLAVAGGYAYYQKALQPTQTTNTSDSGTAVAIRGNLTVSASGSGALVAQTDASFGFDASGQVSQVNVKVGDQVKAGQVLAQLDNILLQMKYDEAQQALQEVYSAASIAAVKQEIATAQDAQVAAHDWLSYLLSSKVIDAEENLATAEQRLADAQAEAQVNPTEEANKLVAERETTVAYLKDKLSQAQTYYKDTYLPETFGRYENVGTRRFPKIVLATYTDPNTGEEVPDISAPSAADIAKAWSDYAQAKETITEGQEYLDALNTGVIPENATGTRLSDFYNAQQALKNAQTALDGTKLIAPISGTVTSLDISIGEQAGTSSVITISQLNQPYVVDAYLDEADWNNAQAGNKATVTFDLLPEQTFPATVATVYPGLVGSGNSSLVHIVVQLDQSISQGLPVGTGASISVVGGEANGVVMVPVNAVHKTDGTYAVTVIQNGQKTERNIEIGIQNETYIEIKSGLNAGETVATG
jgi:HlyD family secretion protein